MQTFYSTGQLARMLGLRPHQIEYAHASGQLPEPEMRFLGKRVYSETDVARLSDFFGVSTNGIAKTANGEADQ